MGEIRLPDGLLSGQLLIDCPLPESFTQEQSQNLTIQYKRINEREMIAALQAVGQKGTADTVYIYNSNPQTYAEFSPLKCGDPGLLFRRLSDEHRSLRRSRLRNGICTGKAFGTGIDYAIGRHGL